MPSGHIFATALCLVLLLGPAELVAHASVTASDPADGATVRAAPRQLELSFSEPIEPRFSLFSLYALGADRAAEPESGTEIPLGAVRAADGNQRVQVSLAEPLASGWYALLWEILAVDGHTMRGVLRFQVSE
ncbi:MAG: copper resistance protein CopC [Aquisalimonadaceae bacterium]